MARLAPRGRLPKRSVPKGASRRGAAVVRELLLFSASAVGYNESAPGTRGVSGARIGGGYLLSHFRSTIGVVRFNFSVRNGKRWSPHAIATLVSSSYLLISV